MQKFVTREIIFFPLHNPQQVGLCTNSLCSMTRSSNSSNEKILLQQQRVEQKMLLPPQSLDVNILHSACGSIKERNAVRRPNRGLQLSGWLKQQQIPLCTADTHDLLLDPTSFWFKTPHYQRTRKNIYKRVTVTTVCIY